MRYYLIFLSLLCFSCFYINAQVQFRYTYDNAGNCVERNYIYYSMSAMVADSLMIESFAQDSLSQSSLRSANKEDDIQMPVYQEELPSNRVLIYPNPTKGDLSVEVTNTSEKTTGEVCLYDMKGKIITCQSLQEEKISFDLGRQPAGIYILKINISDVVSTWKIFKE